MRSLRLLAIAGASVGCTNVLAFSTATQIGIDINATENGQQHAVVGYKRSEGVIMPVVDEDDNLRENAFAVLAASSFETGTILLAGLTTTKVKSVFATGEAAKKPGAVESVKRAYHATFAEILSPEDDWLSLELRRAVEEAPAHRKDAVRKAVWRSLIGNEDVSPRWFLIYGVQREGDLGVLRSALAAGRAAANAPAPAKKVQAEQDADPGRFLIRLIQQKAVAADRNAIYDAIAENLEGPDQVSTLDEDELVSHLVDLAALDDRTTDMRAALTAALESSRG